MRPQLDVPTGRMLVADWFARLAREAGLPLNEHGSSEDSFSFGSPTGLNVTARFSDQPPYLKFVASDISQQELVDRLAHEAFARVANGTFGEPIWHSVSMPAVGFQLAPPF